MRWDNLSGNHRKETRPTMSRQDFKREYEQELPEMKTHRAVLFKDGQPHYHEVGCIEVDRPYPYVMWKGDLYTRSEQADQHDKGRIIAYRRADYYDISKAADVASFIAAHEPAKK